MAENDGGQGNSEAKSRSNSLTNNIAALDLNNYSRLPKITIQMQVVPVINSNFFLK